MWALIVVGALLARAHLQDLVAGVPSDDVILDVTSADFGASRCKQLNFKSCTSSLSDVCSTSTVVAFPSASYALEVQQALLATKVRRFAIFFAPDVPCVLDATDQRYEYIDLTPGGRAFHPELRRSVKGSEYQDIVRVVFFNYSIGTPSAQSINGRDFITSVREPVPPNVCRSFSIKSVQADTNVHRRRLRDVAKQADSRIIDRIARIAARSMAAAGRSTPAEQQMLPLTDVPACIAVLNNIDKHLATTAQLPTTTTASLSVCSRHLTACHDASLS
jgi:hypothetical protein